jgi:hypothetical protein
MLVLMDSSREGEIPDKSRTQSVDFSVHFEKLQEWQLPATTRAGFARGRTIHPSRIASW